ncbi:MAG: YlbF family regulator [Clostridia bacterium]|nr:YlbF family regulator [Clostridia bacterium]
MNQSVIEKAQELAKVISLSPEYITMRATEDAANQEQELTALFDEYNALRAEVEKLSMEKEPDFEQIGDASRQLETVQEQIKAQPMYIALQGARKQFSGMMAQVNAELSAVLNPGGVSGAGCGGNCAGCSGCN